MFVLKDGRCLDQTNSFYLMVFFSVYALENRNTQNKIVLVRHKKYSKQFGDNIILPLKINILNERSKIK